MYLDLFYEDECMPKVVGVHQEPADGEIMTETIYNCETCTDKTCEYWCRYNLVQAINQCEGVIMAWEDCFLRLDPYNFDTQEEFEEFHNERNNRTDDAGERPDSTTQI